MSRRHRRHGFSILELVIVMAVMGLLASLAIPNLNASLKRARSVEALQTLGAIQRSMVEYYNRNGEYPRVAGAKNPVEPGYSQERMRLTLPGWSDLTFRPDATYRYRYSFTPIFDSPGGRATGISLEAKGDTDNDKIVAHYVRILSEGFDVTPNGIDEFD